MDEATCSALRGYAIVPILHVRAGWPDEESQKFRQPCGVQPAACWEALRSGKLKVGEAEYSTTINQTRSHMAGEEGCAGSCGTPVVALERKIVQVLMEVLEEEDWIWWNEKRTKWPPNPGRRPLSSGVEKPCWRTD